LSKKILIIDDDPLVLESLEAALRARGYDVWGTESAERAVELADEVVPDVVVTDYRMPGTDGVSLLERLRDRSAGLVMVVYSAAAPPQARSRQRMRGVHWVAKSPGHGALLQRLRDLLGDEVEAG
jgi:CheY-like chemotaxis protein